MFDWNNWISSFFMTSTLEKIYLNVIKFGIYVLFFVPLLITRDYFFPYIFGKAIILRMIIEVIAVLFILLVLLNRKYMPRRNYLFWGMVVYMTIKAITTLTGVNPFHSFWSNYERMEGFLTLIHFGILFVIMSGVFRTKGEWKWVFRCVVAGGFLVALFGLGQKLNLDFIIHAGIVKIDSTIGNSSYVAAYMIYNIFLLLYLFFKGKNLYWRIFYMIALLVDIIIIFFTASRGGMVGLIGGIILLLFLIIFFVPKEGIGKIYKYCAVGFVVFLLMLGSWFYVSREKEWVHDNQVLKKLTSISFTNRTIQDRFINWRIGWLGFKDRFFLGWGMENYYVPFNKYYDSRTSEPWFDRAHNIVLDQAVTGGIFGILAYLFLLLISIYYLWKRRGRDYLGSFIFISLIAASFFANFFVFDNSTTYTMFFTVLAFVGFLISGEKSEDDFRGKSVSIFLPIGLSIILILSIYFFNIRPAIANSTAIDGYKYSKVDYERSEKFFKEALAFNTFGNAEIAMRVGDNALRIINEEDKAKTKRSMDFAVEALEGAINQESLNARYYLYLGQLYTAYFMSVDASEENIDNAISNLTEAKNLSPNRQEVYYVLGQVMMTIGRNEEAVNYFQKAVDIKADRNALYNFLLICLFTKDERGEEVFDRIDDEGFFGSYRDDKIERLVNIYYGRDDLEKIIKILGRVIERRSDDPGYEKTIAKYHGKLAALYKEMDDTEKAREHAIKAGELDPEIEAEVQNFLDNL